MRRTSPGIASALALALALSACSGHNSLPSLAGNPQAASQSLASQTAASQSGVTHSTLSDKPIVSVPRMFGKLSFSDNGRHPSNAVIRVSLTLRYNHQNQLDELVAKLANSSGSHHRSLSPREFNSYYAPTSEQERSVLRALREAGFTIGKQFANRTLVDATAPTSAVEKFFSTEIHSVHQGQYGDRYTNVRSATVPPASPGTCATFRSIISSWSARSSIKPAAVALRRPSRWTRRGVPSYRSPASRRWTRAAISSTAALRPEG